MRAEYFTTHDLDALACAYRELGYIFRSLRARVVGAVETRAVGGFHCLMLM
jgi:hypothetical protein